MTRFVWTCFLVLWVTCAQSRENPWPGGIPMTSNAWIDSRGDIVRAWAPHQGDRGHRSYHQVLFCDLSEHEVERAMTTPLGLSIEGVPGLRFSVNEINPLVPGEPNWNEFCSLDLYSLGQVWIKRERSPRGFYRKLARIAAYRYADIGRPEGLTADEYICANVLKHPPPALVSAIQAVARTSSLSLDLITMRFDPENPSHRRTREKWAYYGIDHEVLCEGIGQ